jgi:hypothetical protein
MSQIVKRLTTAIRTFQKVLRDPDAQTYYPEEPRKGKWRIFWDNVRWLLKYREINHYYYLYGFDRKKEPHHDVFIAKRKFFTAQAVANGPVSVNGRKIFYGCLLQDKFTFAQYLKSLNLPGADVLALGQRTSIYWINEHAWKPLESLGEKGELDVFIKPILGDSGKGVCHAQYKSGKLTVNSQVMGFSDFAALLSEKYIIQQRIEQSEALSRLCTDTVASLRIITAMKNGKPEYISSLLAMGTGRNKMSNWAAGGVTIGIDPKKGRLNRFAFYKPGFGGKITHHPDTGVAFNAFELPYFRDAVDMAIKAHRYFYGTHSIGWDMAISRTGPVFIEGNNLWEIGALQIDDHYCVKQYLESLAARNQSLVSGDRGPLCK